MKLIKSTLVLLGLAGASLVNAHSTYQSSLPVKPGKGVTVAGTVECDGKPVAGVVVSDGYEVTKTDKKGAYYLKSKKQNPQLFITAPSGYEVYRDEPVPQFWADFTLPADQYERHDFRLNKVDNSKHATILITDVHLANERNDVDIFSGPYVNRIRQEVEKYNEQGIPVYTINLGDAAWDIYWYAHKFDISDFRKTLKKANYPTAVYSVMGNHDNDAHTKPGPNSDMEASLPYQKAMGPRYYSQNIGGVHYVFLDNIHYLNDQAKEPTYYDINNKRNYIEEFTPEQLEWLRKDLANVDVETPVVVSMHGPMFRRKPYQYKPQWTHVADDIYIRTEPKSTQELLDILKPYKNVHTLCGHSHNQQLVRLPQNIQNLTEHNISGTCGSWWRTRATGLNNLCPDGTPTAFEVFTVDGKDLKWDHVPYEYDADQQFFAWDGNGMKEYFKNNPEFNAFKTMYPKWTDYSDVPDNYVYVNLWAWDPDGKLTITENGKELPVEVVNEENPLYTTSYMVRTCVWQNIWGSKGYQQPRKYQLFKAQASTPDAPLEITWTDYFGREHKQTLNRPAPFKLEKLYNDLK